MKNENATRLYYYRPLAGMKGVYKCAGFGAENPQHREFYTAYFTANADLSAGIAAGAPIIREYAGDKIRLEIVEDYLSQASIDTIAQA